MQFSTFFAYDPGDTAEVRIDKFAIFLVAGSCCLAGLIWTAMYYIIYGPSFTTSLLAGIEKERARNVNGARQGAAASDG